MCAMCFQPHITSCRKGRGSSHLQPGSPAWLDTRPWLPEDFWRSPEVFPFPPSSHGTGADPPRGSSVPCGEPEQVPAGELGWGISAVGLPVKLFGILYAFPLAVGPWAPSPHADQHCVFCVEL